MAARMGRKRAMTAVFDMTSVMKEMDSVMMKANNHGGSADNDVKLDPISSVKPEF